MSNLKMTAIISLAANLILVVMLIGQKRALTSFENQVREDIPKAMKQVGTIAFTVGCMAATVEYRQVRGDDPLLPLYVEACQQYAAEYVKNVEARQAQSK